MRQRMTKLIATPIIAATLALAGLGAAQADDHGGMKSVEIGWTAWSDAEFVTKLAKKVIEANYDYEVELTLADIGVQYQGVAKGDLDGMLMAWLPDTHGNYMERVGDEVVDLGPLYEGARLGWIVPNYIPEVALSSIEDLKKEGNVKKLDGTIQGIDPGAGLMQLSETTMEEYGLDDYRLQSASGAAMTAALKRAVDNGEWIVVTGWTPHWKFGRFDLRFLEDPKGTLGQAQHIDAIVRQGFKEDHPEIAAFLTNMYIPLEDLQAAMAKAQSTSYEDAIDAYIAENGDRIQEWIDG